MRLQNHSEFHFGTLRTKKKNWRAGKRTIIQCLVTKISINNSVRRVFTIVTNVRTWYVVVGEILFSVQEIMWYYKKQCTSIGSTEDAELLVKRIHHKANRLKAENMTAQTQWGQRRKTCMRWSTFSLCIPSRQRHLSSSASQRSFFGFAMNQLEKKIYILQETKIRINVNRNEVRLLTRVSQS